MNHSIDSTELVEVAAAVLQREDGSFLLAQRPPNKIWAGYWEFPGGKIEPGETPYEALVRELREELGIEITTAYAWLTRVFSYPHATVRLHFFRVTQWQGELHPHEGQQFAWQLSSSLDSQGRAGVSPVLPANAPILRALSLPDVYAISNVQELGEEQFLYRFKSALQNGLRLIQLREKNYSREALQALALKMLPLIREYGARLVINSDIALALEIGADGVQLTATQLAELRERPSVEWCGASCHSVEELRRAQNLGCDFAVLSPVLPTQSHVGAPHLGWEKFSGIVAGTTIPVYALGGMTVPHLLQAHQHGAHGIALLRQAWPDGGSSDSFSACGMR